MNNYLSPTGGQIFHRRPSSYGVEGVSTAARRITRYGDAFEQMLDFNQLAEEGSFYTATNPAISTTVAFPVSASLSDTAPFYLIYNSDQTKVIRVHYLRMIPTVAPASGTSMRLSTKVDNVPRLPTAGGNSITVNQLNPLVSNDFGGVVHCATGGTALTVPASTLGRAALCNVQVRDVIPVVLEEIVVGFGQPLVGNSQISTVSGSYASAPPLIIPPGCSAAIYIWFPSNAITGLSAEYELGLSQR